MTSSIETQDSDAIKAFQERLLREQLSYMASSSPYYRAVAREQEIDLTAVHTLEDLARLPTTSKDDLQQYNDDFIAVPREHIIDHITTSGTLGDPVTFALTDKDLDRLAYNEAISFACAGCDEKDVMQLMTTIDRRFMAGLAYFLGARKLGAGIVRVGSGIPALQWDTIQRVSPTVLITVPSFLLKLIAYAKDNGIDHRKSSIQKAVCIGEPIRGGDLAFNTLGQQIREQWDIELYNTYASTEMATAFTECQEGTGGHHHPELIVVEFLDEEGNPVSEGEPGEVTVTPLGVEGMPLLRYRTGDICYRYSAPCSCGRNTMRIGPVIGRKQQMIKYKGTTLYPPALFDVLNNIPGVLNYVVEVYTNNSGTDEILVHVGCDEETDQLRKRIRDHFRARLRVAPNVVFEKREKVEQQQFPEMSRKPVKFIDKRNKTFV